MSGWQKLKLSERIERVVLLIPTGCVTSYGAIARALGMPRGARQVGWQLKNTSREVPAHRVVNREGVLTGALHFGHPDAMRHMLEDEGVTFVDDLTVDIERHFWDPADDPRIDELYEFEES